MIQLSPFKTFADPSLDLRDRRLRALLAYWNEKKAEKGRLPSRSDVKPRELLSHLPWLYMLDVQSPGRAPEDFRFRLFGTALRDLFEAELTGKSLAEAVPAQGAPVLAAVFSAAGEHRRPIRIFGTLDWWPNGDHVLVEGLALPLSADGDHVNLILGEFCAYLGDNKPVFPELQAVS